MDVEQYDEKRMRFCPVCKKETELANILGHSIGFLHAGCYECGYCEDCDEGNV